MGHVTQKGSSETNYAQKRHNGGAVNRIVARQMLHGMHDVVCEGDVPCHGTEGSTAQYDSSNLHPPTPSFLASIGP
jgi:hypothetical protein